MLWFDIDGDKSPHDQFGINDILDRLVRVVRELFKANLVNQKSAEKASLSYLPYSASDEETWSVHILFPFLLFSREELHAVKDFVRGQLQEGTPRDRRLADGLVDWQVFDNQKLRAPWCCKLKDKEHPDVREQAPSNRTMGFHPSVTHQIAPTERVLRPWTLEGVQGTDALQEFPRNLFDINCKLINLNDVRVREESFKGPFQGTLEDHLTLQLLHCSDLKGIECPLRKTFREVASSKHWAFLRRRPDEEARPQLFEYKTLRKKNEQGDYKDVVPRISIRETEDNPAYTADELKEMLQEAEDQDLTHSRTMGICHRNFFYLGHDKSYYLCRPRRSHGRHVLPRGEHRRSRQPVRLSYHAGSWHTRGDGLGQGDTGPETHLRQVLLQALRPAA